MKKISISSLLSLALATFLVFLPSCKKAEKYRDGISCEELSIEIRDEVDNFGEATSYSEEDIRLIFGSSSLFDDFSVIYSSEPNDINEVGIFHCPDESAAKKFLAVAKEYVREEEENKKAFVASYAPLEVPKLESAEARRYGNYVIYTILGEDAKEEAFDKAKKILEK